MRCATPKCPNDSDHGTFVGDFCSPCHDHHSGKKSIHSQAYRNQLAYFIKLVAESPKLNNIRETLINARENFDQRNFSEEFVKNRLDDAIYGLDSDELIKFIGYELEQ